MCKNEFFRCKIKTTDFMEISEFKFLHENGHGSKNTPAREEKKYS